jgi:hypothetical protein
MEITFNQLVIRLSGHQPHVRLGISVNQRFSSIGKDLNLHCNSCSIDGDMYSNTSQEMLEVDY